MSRQLYPKPAHSPHTTLHLSLCPVALLELDILLSSLRLGISYRRCIRIGTPIITSSHCRASTICSPARRRDGRSRRSTQWRSRARDRPQQYINKGSAEPEGCADQQPPPPAQHTKHRTPTSSTRCCACGRQPRTPSSSSSSRALRHVTRLMLIVVVVLPMLVVVAVVAVLPRVAQALCTARTQASPYSVR